MNGNIKRQIIKIPKKTSGIPSGGGSSGGSSNISGLTLSFVKTTNMLQIYNDNNELLSEVNLPFGDTVKDVELNESNNLIVTFNNGGKKELPLTNYFYSKNEELSTTASNVLFDDGVSLEQKYLNGELGGGTIDDEILLNYVEGSSSVISVGSSALLKYTFERENFKTRKGSEKVYVDGLLKQTRSIDQGEVNTYVDNLIVGNHTIEVVVSSSGLEATLVFTVEVIELIITSTFNDLAVYTNPITYRYTPIGNIEKTIHFYLNNEEIDTQIVTESNKAMTYEFAGVSHGSHPFKVYATATIGDKTIKSNELTYDLVVNTGVSRTIIGCNFTTTSATQGDLLSFKYIVFNPESINSDVTLSINGQAVSNITVDRTQQTWNVRDYPIGSTTFTISSNGTSKTFTVEVSEAQINVEPITRNLELYLTSQGRSNTESESEREIWKNNNISAEFSNFNWKSNGWVIDTEGNSALRINGDASVTIPYKIFATDFRNNGKTIEFEFSTSEVRDYDSMLLLSLSNNIGFSLTSNVALMKSEQTTIETQFKEDEKVRVSFVIEPISENRLVYTYINGIMSGLAQYPSDDNFTQVNPVNITIGSKDATIDIYNIRIYNINLDHKDSLNNYIADTPGNEKIELYQRNDIFDSFGNINYNKVLTKIPCLTIIGELPGSKGDKKTVNIEYVNLFDTTKNFYDIGSTLDIQGTSSQYYPRKNYKFKLTFFYKLTNGSIEEQVFCIKADYMESSHSHNTGLAKIVNGLYPITPPKELNSKVQAAITGFPIVVWHKASTSSTPRCLGVYNFNNDKDDVTTFGYTSDFPSCESWEFKNNTSAHCLFQTNDFADTEEVAKNFEARYPDKYTNYTALSRVVSWVYSTQNNLEKFKNEFEDYFNLDSTLLYYCLTELFAMVDSRAKNLFLTTWNGSIWYPTFYDMDTSFGLNNEGVNDFSYNVEYHDTQGSQNVFNGESSVLWNNFEQAFAEEINEFYNDLRNNNKVTYDSVMNVLYGEQISQICESNYNYDAIAKYKEPLTLEGIGTYLYVAQGSRLSHLQWWLFNRINYMDSKYVASDYKNNYITLRIYTPETYGSVVPNANAYITPYADQYVTVKYDENEFSERATHDVETIIEAPNQVFNDTPMIIYGASRISSIGDLSPLYPGTVDVSSGIKLKELKIGNSASDYRNTNLKVLAIGNNELLTKLDVTNCIGLTEPIDASGCTNIEEILAKGTSTTAVKLPNGGNLKKLYLPNTITNITILNQKFINDFQCEGFDNVSTIRIENSTVNSLNIVSESIDTLTRVRLLGVDWELENATILNQLKLIGGIDDSGFNQEKSVLTGKVHIKGSVLSTLLDDFREYWGSQLEVTADRIIQMFRVNFYNYDGSLLYTTSVLEGNYATYEGETPTKPRDDTYYYEFKGWNPTLEDAITSDTNYIAEYNSYNLLIVLWSDWNGTLLQRDAVKPNETVQYTSEIPTKPDDEMYKDYSLNEWLGSDGNVYDVESTIVVTQDLILTASYQGTLQTFIVNWYGENDNLLLSEEYSYGSTASYSGNTPTHSEGYTFIGWSRTSGSSNADADFIITSDTNFYAVYDKPDTIEITVIRATTPSYILVSCTGVDEEITIDWGDGDVATYTVTTSGTECAKPKAYALGDYVIKMPATENYKITDIGTTTSAYEIYERMPYKKVSFKYFRISRKEFFNNHKSLTTVSLGNVSSQIGITSIPEKMFYNCYALTNIAIPEGVTRIDGMYTFRGCSALTNVVLPSTLTTIVQNMFDSCTSLSSIAIPEGITSIGRGVFQYCYALSNVSLPASLNTIGNSTFFRCDALTNLTIPENVTSIGTSSLQIGTTENKSTIKFERKTPPTIQTSTFDNTKLQKIIVPASAVEAYKSATNWSQFATYITTDDRGLVKISDQILSLDRITTKDITLTYLGDSPTFTAVSDNTSICNVSVNGDIVTITAVATGTANITVTIGGGVSQTFSVEVLATTPKSTYTVEAIDGVTCGFTLNASGYYESTNQGQGNTFSMCKLTVFSNGTQHLYLDCINSGENNFDFGILSNLDTTLTSNNNADSTNVFKSFAGLSSTNVQTVDYGVIPSGEHFIYVKFIKDGGSNSGNDSLQFQVRFE